MADPAFRAQTAFGVGLVMTRDAGSEERGCQAAKQVNKAYEARTTESQGPRPRP